MLMQHANANCLVPGECECTKLVECIQILTKIVNSSALDSLQVSWLRLLIKGEHSNAGKMDNGTKSVLRQPAAKLMCCFEVLLQLSKLESVSDGIDMPSKAGANELMTRLIQVLYLDKADAESMGFTEHTIWTNSICTLATKQLESLTVEIKKQKDNVQQNYGRFKDIVPVIATWDEAGI